MKYIELKTKLKDFIIFSQRDIKKFDPDFCRQNLTDWQNKGYIKKMIKGYYVFSDSEINQTTLFSIANKIFKPSYVSFESALSYYQLIPESIYAITSASPRNTYTFETTYGNFIYKKIKPQLMFGYTLSSHNNITFNIAEAEKAILDYLYIKTKIKDIEDFEELRIDKEMFYNNVSIKKLKGYIETFKSPSLKKRINKFLRYIKDA